MEILQKMKNYRQLIKQLDRWLSVGCKTIKLLSFALIEHTLNHLQWYCKIEVLHCWKLDAYRNYGLLPFLGWIAVKYIVEIDKQILHNNSLHNMFMLILDLKKIMH